MNGSGVLTVNLKNAKILNAKPNLIVESKCVIQITSHFNQISQSESEHVFSAGSCTVAIVAQKTI